MELARIIESQLWSIDKLEIKNVSEAKSCKSKRHIGIIFVESLIACQAETPNPNNGAYDQQIDF